MEIKTGAVQGESAKSQPVAKESQGFNLRRLITVCNARHPAILQNGI
ncbi:hypothetical protein GRW67_13135 [Escherichia coli]|nr:hypothetical protein [Escherichia coli]MXF71791.1 hypothetical protein [Escherichia coli]MXH26849.1 hypothetical protein [Escherichia coli]